MDTDELQRRVVLVSALTGLIMSRVGHPHDSFFFISLISDSTTLASGQMTHVRLDVTHYDST
jgi:hypothetical protein